MKTPKIFLPTLALVSSLSNRMNMEQANAAFRQQETINIYRTK